MKILQLVQKKQFRGAELFACQLSNELTKRGHEVRMLAMEDGEVALPFPEVEVLGMDTKSFFDQKATRKLAYIIQKWQPDMVQANAGDTVRLAVVSKWLYGWKSPVIMRNASTISQYMKGWFRKAYYWLLVAKVDAVASVSQVSYNDFVHTFPGATSKIHLLPVGIDPGDFAHAIPATGYGNYILHVGGFTFEKNHAGLLRIFKQVLHECPDIVLLCAGDGPLLSDVKQMIEKEQLTGQVILLGRRSDIPSLIKGAKVFVLPSIIEGLPSVILEAMYCSVPVVAYDTGGISQVLTPETGWLIPLQEEKIFSDTVIALLKNQDEYVDEKCMRSKQVVEESFTLGQVTIKFEKVYQQLIQ